MATVTKSTFVLQGADGGPLRGEVRTAGSGRPAVVICHGFKGFKDWGFFPHLADRIARAGMTAVSFNFSGSGVGPDGESFSERDRFGHATHSGDLVDVDRVCGALGEGRLVPDLAEPTGVGLFGHSRGGGTAILAADRQAGIGCLVTWAAIGKVNRWPPETLEQWNRDGQIEVVNARTGDVLPLYRDLLEDIASHDRDTLDIPAAASRLAIPWLLVHGERDEAVPVGDARALHEANAMRSELVIVAGAGHTFGAKHPWGGETPELRLAMDKTAAWFARCLM